MLKRYLVYLVLGFFLVTTGYSISDSPLMECGFKAESNCGDDSVLFHVNKHFTDSSGEILSSPVKIYDSNSNYNKSLCCSITEDDLGDLEFWWMTHSNSTGYTDSCLENEKDILYFERDYNSKVGLPPSPGFPSPLFNDKEGDYQKKLCLNLTEEFSTLDIRAVDTDMLDSYKRSGYDCLYKTSSRVNGVVSSCDASFDGGNQYNYSVVARLWENLDSLKCNNDCTSKLDGRVYAACSQKIPNCRGVPEECDGSIKGSWVDFDSNGDGVDEKEFKCSPPWNVTRSKVFTSQSVEVNYKNTCDNVITKDVSVKVDDRPVTMNVYMCK